MYRILTATTAIEPYPLGLPLSGLFVHIRTFQPMWAILCSTAGAVTSEAAAVTHQFALLFALESIALVGRVRGIPATLLAFVVLGLRHIVDDVGV